MLFRYILLITGLLHLPGIFHAQEEMGWAPKALLWNLYTPQAEGTGSQSAFSYVGVEYRIIDIEGRPAATYFALFKPGESWYKTGSDNAALLNHEQRLFDLTEVYARKMRRDISFFIRDNPDLYSVSALLPQVRTIYKERMNELLLKIQSYNVETMNGKNAKAQQKWNTYIDAELKKLSMFRMLSEGS